MPRFPAQWLPPGAFRAAPGELDVAGGGLTFRRADGVVLFAVAGRHLQRVGRGPQDMRLMAAVSRRHVIVIEGAGATYVVQVFGEDCRLLLDALVAARHDSGLAAVPVRDGRGRWVPPPPGAPAPPSHPEDLPLPTPAEQQGLPIGTLPGAWLVITADAEPWRSRQIDGMSMLLELALRGVVDVPKRGEQLVVAEHRTGRGRSRRGGRSIATRGAYATPGATAHRLGSYVRALHPTDLPGPWIAAVREAIASRRAADPRTALLVWLVKQDQVLLRVALPVLFPGRQRGVRRALKWCPPLRVGDDREATLRAHRVLAATMIQPPPGGV